MRKKVKTIKPDGGGIKHAKNSQRIDKRIQFGQNTVVWLGLGLELGLGLGLGTKVSDKG